MRFLLAGLVATVAIVSSASSQSIKTPFLDGYAQTPLSKMEQQAHKYPETFVIAGPSSEKAIAFTYDDGPTPFTSDLLDVLDKHNIKVTFFWMGANMQDHPEIVRRTLLAGHSIAHHSHTHPRTPELPDTAFMEQEIEKAQYVFRKQTGVAPIFYRPPYGDISDKQIELVAESGMKVIAWSLNTDDWFYNGKPDGQSIIEGKVKEHHHSGAIVLMHDGGGNRAKTVAATDNLIPYLKEQGYQFKTVDALLNLTSKN